MRMLRRGTEEVGERVMGDRAALFDPRGLVEGPVNAEIDAALAVFLRRLAEAGKRSALERAGVSVDILVHAVELIGNKREGDVIGAIEVLERTEDRSAERRVAGRVGGERRREVARA